MISGRTLLFLAALPLLIPAVFAQSPFMSSCAEDKHIEIAKGQAIHSVASDFLEKLLGPNPDGAFDMLSDEGKTNATPQQLKSQAMAIVQLFEPKNISLQHTYLIQLKGKSPGRVVCGTDFSKPDGWESLGAASVPEQAHVVMSAETRNNQLAFTLWLVPEQKTWKVQSFWVNVATLADKDSMQLWQLGRAQEAKGHNFNAAILYTAAAQVANRGPSFQMGIAQSISQDLAKLAVPSEIQGPPPFSWKNGDKTYKINGVGPIAVGGKIYLMIAQEVQPWGADEEVDGWNKELLGYFKLRFPEYSNAFAGLVARATERGGTRGYRTVEELSAAKSPGH